MWQRGSARLNRLEIIDKVKTFQGRSGRPVIHVRTTSLLNWQLQLLQAIEQSYQANVHSSSSSTSTTFLHLVGVTGDVYHVVVCCYADTFFPSSNALFLHLSMTSVSFLLTWLITIPPHNSTSKPDLHHHHHHRSSIQLGLDRKISGGPVTRSWWDHKKRRMIVRRFRV